MPNEVINYKTSTNNENKNPNEGVWIMEGAQNFERRNKIAHTTDEIITSNIVIDNVLEEGETRINMVDMVSEYLGLNIQIQAKETELNKSAKIVDLQITNISATQTEIEVKVVYGTSGTSAAATWPTTDLHIYDATVILNDEINTHLSNTVVNTPAPPTPTLTIDEVWVNYWNWYAGVNIDLTTNPSGQAYDSWGYDAFCNNCLYRATNNPYYPFAYYPHNFDAIQWAAQDIIDLNGSGNLVAIGVEGGYPLNGLSGTSHAMQWFTSITTANTYLYEPPIGSN